MLLHLDTFLRLGFFGLGPVLPLKLYSSEGYAGRAGIPSIVLNRRLAPTKPWDVNGLVERRGSLYTGFPLVSKGYCSIANRLRIGRAKPEISTRVRAGPGNAENLACN
jgi:hypothetical protein